MFSRWRERLFSTKKFSRKPARMAGSSAAEALRKTGFPHYEQLAAGPTKHSDFFKDFCWYCQLIVDQGAETARRLMRQNLELQLTAVGHEMKGQHAQAAMLVEKNAQGQIIFCRNDARGGSNLEEWYLSGGVKNLVTDQAEQHYFAAEDHQVGRILTHLREWLSQADSPSPTSKSWQKINLKMSSQLVTLLPSLRGSITEPTFVSPSFITLSPPSPVHNKGETSFIWLSKVVHFPRLNKTVAIRDGFFSKYPAQDLLRLAQLTSETAPQAPSFEELLTYISQLPQEFQDKHAWTIIQELITAAGIAPFKAVPPVPGASGSFTLPVADLAESILTIFDRELAAGNHWDQDLSSRLTALTEVLLHHIGTDTPISQPAVLQHYFEYLFPDKKSKKQKKTVSNDDKKQSFQEAYSKIYAPLATVRLDLSLLDCGFGSIVGGFSRSLIQGLSMSPEQLLAMPLAKRLQTVMKNKSSLEKKGLTTTTLPNGETWLHRSEYDIHLKGGRAWGPCIPLVDGEYDCVLLRRGGTSALDNVTTGGGTPAPISFDNSLNRTVGLSEVFSGADTRLAAA
jgi:hypothetical protein